MKDKFRNFRDYILDIILQYNYLISIISSLIILFFFHNGLILYFFENKQDILNMVISISGTLFGFILTFLSIFIVFKTEDKYRKNANNGMNPLIILVNNESFYDVYKLFIKTSYSLGLLLIIAIMFYFTTYGLNWIINLFFIILISQLIVLCIIRMMLSLHTFNTLIKILISNDIEKT